ncbi:MAG: hypothetical protein IBX50_04245 [Marinospirillum sp.]|uniref:hypothetical protein n=1 Tax=Marinospirillum sp. TaxID=2183934 RepID=UPI0019EE0708|nr:hypothetical protein [Marinospirillum sp.]MBE0505917.1 hypothetical protein [Marinospirillum sp.]
MQIPPLQLPSNPEKIIYLREATVEDCEYFAETDSSAEESLATEVLSLLQSSPDKYVDPRTWTADDRRLAAFWYFIATSTDTTIHAPYECPHCGHEHDPLIEMKDLGKNYMPITGRPWRDIEHEGKKLKVVPHDGFLMEELESLRMQMDGQSDNKQLAIIKRHDLVGTLIEHGDTAVRDRRIEIMEKWVRSLPLTSFLTLKEKRDAALDSMRHGLTTGIHDGRLFIWITVHCEEKKDDVNASVRLRLPFRLGELLPRLL